MPRGSKCCVSCDLLCTKLITIFDSWKVALVRSWQHHASNFSVCCWHDSPTVAFPRMCRLETPWRPLPGCRTHCQTLMPARCGLTTCGTLACPGWTSRVLSNNIASCLRSSQVSVLIPIFGLTLAANAAFWPMSSERPFSKIACNGKQTLGPSRLWRSQSIRYVYHPAPVLLSRIGATTANKK